MTIVAYSDKNKGRRLGRSNGRAPRRSCYTDITARKFILEKSPARYRPFRGTPAGVAPIENTDGRKRCGTCNLVYPSFPLLQLLCHYVMLAPKRRYCRGVT